MSIEPIPSGYTDPIAYVQRRRSTPAPEATSIARAVGKPTPYLDESGLSLASRIAESRLPSYGSTGGVQSSSSRGKLLDITA